MATAIQVPGAAPILVNTGSSFALATLGYTRDGGELRNNAFTLDVHTDDQGGEAGPPADVQYMGESEEIDLEMTKWDSTVAAALSVRLILSSALTAGTPGTPGTLYTGGTGFARIVINCPTLVRNYPNVHLREPIITNRGTKFATLRIVGTAYRNGSGVLWNTTNT